VLTKKNEIKLEAWKGKCRGKYLRGKQVKMEDGDTVV
jgi:hypothetical protein